MFQTSGIFYVVMPFYSLWYFNLKLTCSLYPVKVTSNHTDKANQLSTCIFFNYETSSGADPWLMMTSDFSFSGCRALVWALWRPPGGAAMRGAGEGAAGSGSQPGRKQRSVPPQHLRGGSPSRRTGRPRRTHPSWGWAAGGDVTSWHHGYNLTEQCVTFILSLPFCPSWH